MTEEWRPCHGGLYAVSSLGRMRRMAHGKGTFPGRMLNPTINTQGYRVVGPSVGGAKRSIVKVCWLVAEAFLGPRPFGFDVNHKNGIKTDDRISNLEYTTHADNVRHAFLLGLVPKRFGLKNRAKLTPMCVRVVRRLSGVVSQCEVARILGVRQATISAIQTGLTWADVHSPCA